MHLNELDYSPLLACGVGVRSGVLASHSIEENFYFFLFLTPEFFFFMIQNRKKDSNPDWKDYIRIGSY
jgi:hypothetical protein